MTSKLVLVSRSGAFAALFGLLACAGSARPAPTTPPFESKMPSLATRFGDLADKSPSKDACAELVAAATFASADTPDGAAIALTPRGGRGREDVIKAGHAVEQSFLPGVRDAKVSSCGLFAKDDEVNVHLSDSAGQLKLIFETFAADQVPGIQAKVKAFATQHGR